MTKGSCLCGAVEFEFGDNITDIGMCHCSKCRKVSGTASNATLMVGTDGFEWISGEDNLLKYAMADGWGTWRCAVCGSPVPRLHPGGGAYWIPAGSLDEDPGRRGRGAYIRRFEIELGRGAGQGSAVRGRLRKQEAEVAGELNGFVARFTTSSGIRTFYCEPRVASEHWGKRYAADASAPNVPRYH